MGKTIFIDGRHGTTGLQIHERLERLGDIEIIEIPQHKRKDLCSKVALAKKADLTISCLPDDASRKLAAELPAKVKLLDASTAFRTDPSWTYGLPELQPSQRNAIRNALRVSNPGCYPTAVILLLKPLIAAGLLPTSAEITLFAESGYSGGGKSLIAAYEADGGSQKYPNARPYALGLDHKHLPEMQHFLKLSGAPVFVPLVGAYKQGMLVQIPLRITQFNKAIKANEVLDIWSGYYENEPLITVCRSNDTLTENGYMDPAAKAGWDDIELSLFGDDACLLLTARLDNLGKGAAGVALQNAALMLGLSDECAGLRH